MKINITRKGISLGIHTNFKVENIEVTKIEKLLSLIILSISLIVGVIFWNHYYSQGLSLSYNDARSHLNISRRVFDSLQPGLAQLGSVWLPLPHVLMLPTIYIDFFYYTGLSGSLISIISYSISCLLIYKTCRRIGIDNVSSIAATVAFASCQNILFMQTTPMTEPLLLMTLNAGSYFLVSWIASKKVSDLILSSIAIFLSVLTRYDGWFLLVTTSISVFVISFLIKNIKKSEANLILFISVGALGILMWLFWNKLIFGEWLFFMNGTFSAKAQQDILFSQGRLLTKDNLGLSILTYIWATYFNSGPVVAILGFFGLLIFLFSKHSILIKIGVLSFISPIIFNIISLYLGQSVIHLPNIPPYTWFNVRYGLMALPALSIGIGYLVNRNKLLGVMGIFLIITSSILMKKTGDIITVVDGIKGSSGYFLDDIGEWMNSNARDGLILVAASSHDSLIFISKIPVKNWITEGAEKYWKESMVNPQTYAKYIVMGEGDLVYKELHDNANFIENYKLVYDGTFSDVYKRIEK